METGDWFYIVRDGILEKVQFIEELLIRSECPITSYTSVKYLLKDKKEQIFRWAKYLCFNTPEQALEQYLIRLRESLAQAEEALLQAKAEVQDIKDEIKGIEDNLTHKLFPN